MSEMLAHASGMQMVSQCKYIKKQYQLMIISRRKLNDVYGGWRGILLHRATKNGCTKES